jgi:putative ABC transport system permease protein
LADSKKKMFTHRLFLGMQYGITIIVIAATLVVQKQLHFMKNSDPGFNMENIFITQYPYNKYKSETRKELFKNRILQHPDVEKAAFAHTYPPYGEPSFFSIEFNDKTVPTHTVYLHPGFFEVLEIPIVAGRNFRHGSQADKENWETNQPLRVMLNETAVKAYGIEDPVGYMGTVGERKVEIIGVVKDYHQQSLKTKIPPIVFTYNPMAYSLIIKTRSGKYRDVMQHIAKVRKEMFNLEPFFDAVLEDQYKKPYRREEQMAKLFIWFSMLSVIIAVMGLFGISTYAMQRRIKEIGIRKVNGAHSWNIMKLLQAYFTKIVLWAGIITLPISWYLANQWLLNYPYKTDLNWWIFLGALIFVFLIAILTISWKTWKAANGNPVDALRYE